MKKSKFSDSQIMDALKRVEAGLSVSHLCRDLGISTPTFYKWRAKYGGMDTSMMARMKELEDENRRLKKMYLEEKLKAGITNEYLAKKESCRHADATRWQKKLLRNTRNYHLKLKMEFLVFLVL